MIVLVSLALASVAAAHAGHDHTVDSQKPFVGWTQEDLDAKWGTDVCWQH